MGEVIGVGRFGLGRGYWGGRDGFNMFGLIDAAVEEDVNVVSRWMMSWSRSLPFFAEVRSDVSVYWKINSGDFGFSIVNELG